jgi:hypothetical protein
MSWVICSTLSLWPFATGNQYGLLYSPRPDNTSSRNVRRHLPSTVFETLGKTASSRSTPLVQRKFWSFTPTALPSTPQN